MYSHQINSNCFVDGRGNNDCNNCSHGRYSNDNHVEPEIHIHEERGQSGQINSKMNNDGKPANIDKIEPEISDTIQPENNNTIKPEIKDTIRPEINEKIQFANNDTNQPEINSTQ